MKISIHFPHRGRHAFAVAFYCWKSISIHFPHRGRHKTVFWSGQNYWYFNPLPPQGKTRRCTESRWSRKSISIHFPHRGRHQPSSFRRSPSSNFNPLPPQGKTRVYGRITALIGIFQSTSPTGEDTHTAAMGGLHPQYFNPLPPQGKTQVERKCQAMHGYFNPLPPQGKTHKVAQHVNFIIHFNPLPPQGKTPLHLQKLPCPDNISIHFPHRGRHHVFQERADFWHISIHFPHRGRHQPCGCGASSRLIFQSTSPTGEDTAKMYKTY